MCMERVDCISNIHTACVPLVDREGDKFNHSALPTLVAWRVFEKGPQNRAPSHRVVTAEYADHKDAFDAQLSQFQ